MNEPSVLLDSLLKQDGEQTAYSHHYNNRFQSWIRWKSWFASGILDEAKNFQQNGNFCNTNI